MKTVIKNSAHALCLQPETLRTNPLNRHQGSIPPIKNRKSLGPAQSRLVVPGRAKSSHPLPPIQEMPLAESKYIRLNPTSFSSPAPSLCSALSLQSKIENPKSKIPKKPLKFNFI